MLYSPTVSVAGEDGSAVDSLRSGGGKEPAQD